MIVRNPRRPHIPDPIDFHVLPTIIFQIICRLVALLLRIPEHYVPSLHEEKRNHQPIVHPRVYTAHYFRGQDREVKGIDKTLTIPKLM